MICAVFGIILALMTCNAWAETRTLSKVVWISTSADIQHQLAKVTNSLGKAQLHIFSVDESKRILEHFEAQFPEEINSATEIERMAYLNEHITPRLKSYAPELMRSEMGISLAKFYDLERIPAVIINDRYVTYGISVSESILAFYRQKDQAE
nr:hypothetical protein BCU62_15335 [Enterovibrio norvegicus]